MTIIVSRVKPGKQQGAIVTQAQARITPNFIEFVEVVMSSAKMGEKDDPDAQGVIPKWMRDEARRHKDAQNEDCFEERDVKKLKKMVQTAYVVALTEEAARSKHLSPYEPAIIAVARAESGVSK